MKNNGLAKPKLLSDEEACGVSGGLASMQSENTGTHLCNGGGLLTSQFPLNGPGSRTNTPQTFDLYNFMLR